MSASSRFDSGLLFSLLPRRLGHQMLTLSLVLILLALVLLNAFAAPRFEASALRQSQEWAEAVARSAASMAGPGLQERDARKAESSLLALASLPGVMRLALFDAEGSPILALQTHADGRVTVATDALLPSRPVSRRPQAVRLESEDAVQAWVPAGPAGVLGSVGVSVSIEPARHALAAFRYEGLWSVLFTALIVSAIAYLHLDRALEPLARMIRFAGALPMNPGSSLPVQRGSIEMEELGTALNDASSMLRNQLHEVEREQARSLTIVNAVPDVIIGLDGECRINFSTPGVASVFGIQADDMLGMHLHQLLPGVTAEDAELRTQQGLFMRSTRAHVARFDINAQRHDGTEFPAEVSLSRIETEEGPRYAAVVRDTTEQRMTMEMLNLYSRALECTNNGVVISDMQLPGNPVFYANPAFYRITGYEPGEAIGRNCSFLQREDNQQPELEELRRAVSQDRSAEVVLRNYRKDGSLFFNELAIAPLASRDGRVLHYVGVLTDVTERERARMAIAERSARLNTVFELSPDGFVVFDAAGQLAYCNPSFQAMTGWDDGGEGLSLHEFDQRFAGLCEPNQAYAPVERLVGADSEVDGSHTLMLAVPERRVLARVVRSQSQGRGESILFFRDVTRETEVDRMKSEFLTTAAHELRTPMVSVFGFTELLLRRQVTEERRKDMLETIHRQASLLINMVNELLDLARIEARQGKDLKREACRIDSLITQAVGPLVCNPARHEFVIDVPHGDGVMWVDPEKTHRALTNVLSNAIKYSPDGGPIMIVSRLGMLRGEKAVALTIADRGIGMTGEQLARVFERFFRADPSGNIPGTGLGMCLVKEIVELQGGRVEIESQLGEGTRVTLWLPLLDVVDASAAPTPKLAIETTS
jgi:PAS domain S-box-containing protein